MTVREMCHTEGDRSIGMSEYWDFGDSLQS